ncbi:MAG: DUF262 domain-containing HNH endonuclease family protein [Moraxella sp.]|nr:DUF262 domain-containing HNH endonuclease family protein [Moraxella sp.]
MDAGKRTISSIFDRNWHLDIPFFQRSYVWGEEEWERFLGDMYEISDSDQEFFLGSVILKDESETIKNKMVIDGQQRLTTLVLFFKVLSLLKGDNNRFDNMFKTIDDNKSIIRHNKNDRKTFELILNLAILQEIDNPRNKIEECFNYFKENIDADRLDISILSKRITFVGIYLYEHENEQQIFDTINSSGVRLTSAELIKNLLFKTDELDFYKKYWQDIFEKDTETIEYWDISTDSKDNKNLIDIFLFAFLQIKSKHLPSHIKKGFNQSVNLFCSYKKLMAYIDDKEVFLQDMEHYANLFRKNFNPNIKKERLSTQMDRINLIIFEGNLFSIIPYVIFILAELEQNPDERDKVLFILESYLIRRMLGIDKGTLIAKDYAELFGNRLIVGNIISAKALKIHFMGYKNTHLHYVPTDNEITYLLKNKSQTQKRALLVFYLLDNMKRQAQSLENLYGFDKYSADYFMPLKWQKNWSRPLDEQTRQIAVKTLGNMTITPQKLNNALKDATWYERVHGKGKMKGLLAHNHLHIAKPILQKPEWTDDDIFRNNERLAKLICDVWQLS